MTEIDDVFAPHLAFWLNAKVSAEHYGFNTDGGLISKFLETLHDLKETVQKVEEQEHQ